MKSLTWCDLALECCGLDSWLIGVVGPTASPGGCALASDVTGGKPRNSGTLPCAWDQTGVWCHLSVQRSQEIHDIVRGSLLDAATSSGFNPNTYEVGKLRTLRQTLRLVGEVAGVITVTSAVIASVLAGLAYILRGGS
ncbi:hypothetical protein ACO229_06985 [Promicromonospora sp. MS192]|uniref:hypothetical protein n=1 Tax=Promicromonospora sp. MS192 TaxID=3412684 RepID=UPI003C2E414B